jgi:hypothetical protein
MIRPESLDAPERGLEIATPEETVEFEERPLRERIAAARHLVPSPQEGCRSCWQHGRDAAIALVAGAVEGDGMADRLALARALAPTDAERHWLFCWERGRDAALRVIEGE